MNYLILPKDLDEKHNLVTAYLLQGYPVLAVWVRNGMDHGHEGINTSKQYR
jgi:hypothetical protein